MMKVYNDNHQPYKALEVWKILQNSNIPLDSLCHAHYVKTLIYLLPGKGLTTFLAKLKEADIVPDLQIYNILLAGLVKTQNYDAETLFSEIEDVFGASEETYMHMMSFYGKANEVHKVDRLWSALISKNLQASVLAYNCILGVYLKNNLPVQFERIYTEMRSENVQPNIDTFNILLMFYLQSQRYDELFQIWRRLKRRGPNPNNVTCNTMMKAYIRRREFRECEELFHQMKKNGVHQCHISHYYLLKAYMHMGEEEKIIEIRDKMSRLRMPIDNSFFQKLFWSWDSNRKDSWLDSSTNFAKHEKRRETDLEEYLRDNTNPENTSPEFNLEASSQPQKNLVGVSRTIPPRKDVNKEESHRKRRKALEIE